MRRHTSPAALLLIYLCLPSAVRSQEVTYDVRELQATVEFLAADAMRGRAAGTQEGQIATAYVESRFKAYGLRPAGEEKSFFQSFEGGRNVLGLLRGKGAARKELILVGAHVDHLGTREGQVFNGADDNASGVAVMLELARVLSAREKSLRRSVLFVAFDGEEQGLRGSRHFCDEPLVPLENIALMINLDMVGRSFADMFATWLFVVGSEYLPDLERTLTARTSTGKPLHLMFFSAHLLERFFATSDHAPFWKRDIPFLFFSTSMHKDYHRPTDDARKVNPKKMHAIASLLGELIEHVANGEQRPEFRKPDSLVTAADRRSLVSLLTPALAAAPLLGLSGDDKTLLQKVIADVSDEEKVWTEGEVSFLARRLRGVMARVMR